MFKNPKNSHNDGSKPSSNDGKKVDEDPRKGNKCKDQEKEDNLNSTNNVNVAGTNKVNADGGIISSELPFDLNMPALEDISIFDFSSDHEDDGAMTDMNNLYTTIQVSLIQTIRIHKDHPLDQLIGDFQSATQTRKMIKNLKEHGFIKEEVYVCQPSGFEDLNFPDRVYKVKKALYGLHQAPKAWFTKVKTVSIPMETQKPLLKDKDGEEVDVHIYQVNLKISHLHAVKRIFKYLKVQEIDSGCKFHNKVEYVVASSCCGQVLWIQKQLLDYGNPKRKDTHVPQPSGPTKFVTDEAVHKELGDRLVPRSRGDTTAQTRFESVSKHSNDSLLTRGNTVQSDKDRLELNELMALCTNLQTRVLELEKTKTTQQNKINSLKKRFKKLKKRNRSRTHKLKRLYKVRLTARVESSGDEESLGGEDVFVAEQEVVKDVNKIVVKEVVNAAQDNTATTTINTKETTLAQALEALKTLKTKVKGIVIHEQEEPRKSTTTTIPKQQSQDKGKGIMVEEPVKPKKKDQIRLDKEAAKI
uniref:Reverse transcriptase n=1 Tax=Tanacetum cinerariifolium TaxID=118510 RepID=A0A6L2LR36_TANCI|nr:reverse transcriptase [Tanacetum cinerariifolium]